jgi:YD repeat-containing protein
VLTVNGPRANVNVTTYSYYSDVSPTGDYRPGDLQSITDALGEVTRFTRYDPYGQPLETVAPNGITTRFTYDARGHLRTISAGKRTTTFEYDAAGQRKRVTQPDGSFTAFTYDAAHRLVGATDSRGNTLSYTRDDVGHVVSQKMKDPAGALTRTVTTLFDSLGRVQQTNGARR